MLGLINSRSSALRRRPVAVGSALALVASLSTMAAEAAPAGGTIERVSVPDGGGERNVLPTGSSLQCNAQNAGKCTKRTVAVDTAGNKIRVVWASAANNLVPNDNNGHSDIFLTTLTPGAAGAPPTIDSVERINIGPGGVEANGESQGPSISPNGQWISFDSQASNLVGGDNNSANDVFVYNVTTKALYRASVAQAPATEGTGASFASSIADDGTTSFTSYNALVPGATTTFQQVYVRKSPASSPSTVLVSVNTGGTSSGNAPSLESTINAAGTKVAFTTNADDVVSAGSKTKGIPDIAVRDLGANTTKLVSHDAKAGAASLSADGSQVAFIAEAIGPNKGIYKVGTNAMATTNDFVAACTSNSCQSKPKAAVLPSLNANGSAMAFQSSAKYNDLQINSDQVWTWTTAATLVSHDRGDANKQAIGGATNPSISPDGNYVAFESAAENLVADDFNGSADVFLAQPAAPGATIRVSVPSTGGEASGFAPVPTAPPAVSADGGLVAFESDSSNLVAGDTNGVTDIFVRDRPGGHTERVSVATDGTQANKGSFKPGISADGRFVVFESAASNLLPGGADTNGVKDIFLHDRQTKETKRISETNAASPSQNASISANGKFIAFDSNGNFGPIQGSNANVTNVFRYSNPAAGGDGSIIMVSTQPPGKNNPSRQAPNGKSSFQPSVANDGTVAFLSDATGLTGFDGDDPAGAKPNYTDVYVAAPSGAVTKASMSNSTYQAADGSTHQSPATGDSYRPSISADGTKVAFASDATNLPSAGADQNPDTDVFIRDIPGNATRLVDQPPNGVPGGASTAPAVNADGSAVAFVSAAPNLVPGDTNGAPDVFLANVNNGGIIRISARPGAEGLQADGASYLPGISGNGMNVAFGSNATNLVDGDQNHAYDVFLRTVPDLPAPCSGCRTSAAPVYSGPGYRFVAADGGVFAFGDAKFYGSAGATKLSRPIVGMASTPSNGGYWLVASDGGIFAYGDARFFGSTGAIQLNSPIVGMTPTPGGQGYWFVAADGGIFSFGDAKFFGSMGGQPLSRPIVGMASTPSGKGYWLVASDGGIFSFGDAKFFGSTGNVSLTKPIVGMDRTNTGNGYRFVASDGGIFSFGDARFLGSMGGKPLAKPIVGMARTRQGDGYWLVGQDGAIYNFGAAGFQGSTADQKLGSPIVAMAN
jgi:Tol biopolymer transport system component/ribosomal protein L24E